MTIVIGEMKPIVESVTVERRSGEFTRATLVLILPHFGAGMMTALRGFDIQEILGSASVKKAVEQEVEEKLRTITFDDQ